MDSLPGARRLYRVEKTANHSFCRHGRAGPAPISPHSTSITVRESCAIGRWDSVAGHRFNRLQSLREYRYIYSNLSIVDICLELPWNGPSISLLPDLVGIAAGYGDYRFYGK